MSTSGSTLAFHKQTCPCAGFDHLGDVCKSTFFKVLNFCIIK